MDERREKSIFHLLPPGVCLLEKFALKFFDIALFQIAIFMYKFHNNVLPAAFHSFVAKVASVHNYNTRFAAKHSYYPPDARTNYGKFNIRFQGPSVWNAIDDNVKSSFFISVFKKRLKDQYVERYLGLLALLLLLLLLSSSYPAPNLMNFLINIFISIYVLCCFVFVYSVCRTKLVVNICKNWLPIIIYLSVILGSQYSLNLFLLSNKCKTKTRQKREK